MIFSHVNHVVDIFDFLIHVDGHCGNDFPDIIGSLLIMLFHEMVFVENTYREWLEFSELIFNLISLMFELLIFLFDVFNEGHEILYFKIESNVCIVIGGFFAGWDLRD